MGQEKLVKKSRKNTTTGSRGIPLDTISSHFSNKFLAQDIFYLENAIFGRPTKICDENLAFHLVVKNQEDRFA